MVLTGFDDRRNAQLARVFIEACTRRSEHSEDILPQEAGPDGDCSPFHVFSLVFPEIVGKHGSGRRNKRMRLHFNKIGYTIFQKEQSRRVPAASTSAKPGNPGYGFRRACWRDTIHNAEDSLHCDTTLRAIGCDEEQIQRAKVVVQEFRNLWERLRKSERRPGPGRPRKVHIVTHQETEAMPPALGNTGFRVCDIIESPLQPLHTPVSSISTQAATSPSSSLCAKPGANFVFGQPSAWTVNEYHAAMVLQDLATSGPPLGLQKRLKGS